MKKPLAPPVDPADQAIVFESHLGTKGGISLGMDKDGYCQLTLAVSLTDMQTLMSRAHELVDRSFQVTVTL